MGSPIDGITQIGTIEPGALDGDPGRHLTQPTRFKNRPARAIDIVLKSSPTHAIAAVDGVQIGTTPTYWFGDSDGREHEFTFVLRGHAVARYRFVPIQSGVVHARLEPVRDEPLDGGLEPSLAPTFTPEPAIAPPTTVLWDGGAVDERPTGSANTVRGESPREID